ERLGEVRHRDERSDAEPGRLPRESRHGARLDQRQRRGRGARGDDRTVETARQGADDLSEFLDRRRVVTGLDDEGRSCILIDGPVPRHGPVANLIWRTATVPADNSGNKDAALPYDNAMLHDGGANFILTEFP